MTDNKELLKQCLQEIEDRLNWGPSSGWTNDDFEALSDKIWENSGVRLSLSTMRRLWGRVRYDSNPHPDTLNALAKFSGYTDWRAFSGRLQPVSSFPSTKKAPDASYKKRLFIGMIVIDVAATLILGAFFVALREKDDKPDAAYPYKLSARRTSESLPNSVVFDYDAGPAAKHVMIQQNWDSSRREAVDPRGTQHTSLYYIPGFFRARLLVEGKVVVQTPLLIPSHGWKAMAGRSGIPVYFARKDWYQPGRFSLSADQVSKAVGRNELNDVWAQFTLVQEFPGVDSADFMIAATLRNTAPVERSLCRKVQLTIMASNYPVFIPLSDRGCISDLNIAVGDTLIKGKQHDLSGLGCDFREPQQLVCAVRDHHVMIYHNKALLFSIPIRQLPGSFKGLRILVEGAGEVTGVQLTSRGKTTDLAKDAAFTGDGQ